MLYGAAADAIVLVHALFVCFVVLGGLLALRWPRAAIAHLPAAAWGAAIEVMGWICPLTPLEVRLRTAAGEQGYSGGFIDHYVERLLYPPGLTRGAQLLLGGAVIVVNVALYAVVAVRMRRRRGAQAAGPRAAGRE